MRTLTVNRSTPSRQVTPLSHPGTSTRSATAPERRVCASRFRGCCRGPLYRCSHSRAPVAAVWPMVAQSGPVVVPALSPVANTLACRADADTRGYDLLASGQSVTSRSTRLHPRVVDRRASARRQFHRTRLARRRIGPKAGTGESPYRLHIVSTRPTSILRRTGVPGRIGPLVLSGAAAG